MTAKNDKKNAPEAAQKPRPDTHAHDRCGCKSCGGRPVPADDLETRRKIERYRNKHYG